MNLHVLHVFDHSVPLHSGYTFRSANILRGQRRLGWHLTQLTSPKQGRCQADQEQVDDLAFHRTRPPTGLAARLPAVNQWAMMRATQRRLLALAQHLRPDLLHAHSPVLNAWPAIHVGRRLGIPVVYEIRAFWEDAAVDHGTQPEWGIRYRLTRAMETRAVRAASQVVTICEGLRGDLVGRGISSAKIGVVPNAVDAEQFSLGGVPNSQLKASLGLAGSRVIGFLGSYYAYEGLDLLIQSLPLILERAADVKILLVGGGPQEARLKTQVQAMNLGDKVVFVGRVPHAEVNRYYDLVDLLAYPRHARRLTDLVTPLKPLEAMAQGRLLIASDVGGHRELITDGVTGVLFRADDIADLAAKAVATLDRADAGASLRANARRFVEQERTWTRSIDNYKAIYGRALNRTL